MPDSHNQNGPAEAAPSKVSAPPQITVEDDPRNGNDALCFTPGFPGATFGAGVIHAYLAADRDPPQVAAGISLGTVSAAVMQRCYADLLPAKKALEDGKLDSGAVEAARWKFFRKYLSAVTDRPFQVIWKGIPDPADFMAELPPIRDPVPDTLAESVRDDWKKAELDSRRELYLLVKFGHWMARLPVRVSAIANTLVTYVRAKENYSSPALIRWAQYILWQVAVVISLILHIVRVPARFPHYKFEPWKEKFDLPEWLIALRARLLFPREDTKWSIFIYRAPILFTASMCASRSAAWSFYQLRNPDGWVLQSVYWAIFVVSGFTTISLSAVWLIIKDGLVLRLVAAVWCVLSLALLFLFPWALDPTSYFPTDIPVTVFWNILTALLYLSVLLALTKRSKLIRKLWFQACNVIAWILRRPLFGIRVYLASVVILAILQLWTANLAIIFLDLIWTHSPWVRAFSYIGAAVSLFFTTALATWWIPMKGKFPFRAIPMACSIGTVGLLVLAREVWLHQDDGLLVWPMNFDSTHTFEFLVSFWSFLKVHTLLASLIRHPYLFSFAVLLIAMVGIVVFFIYRLRARLIKFLLKKVAMQRHIVHDYHLRRALTSLFGDHAVSPPLTSEPFPLVMVATPLQTIGAAATLNNQLWARVPKKSAPADIGNENGSASAGSTTPNELPPMLVDVLRATLAVPAVFDPYPVRGAEASIWSNRDSGDLDLVDAAIVRQNPLPALFSFLQRNPEIAGKLESSGIEDAKVHVVYNVPTQVARASGSAGSNTPPGAANAPQGLHHSPKERNNGNLTDIVDVALLSMRLAQRRDINLEIDQTNFISKLARVSRDLADELASVTSSAEDQSPKPNKIFPVFADHIVPPGDLNFKNPIAPKEQEVLRHAAAGCKATLQRLYARQISKMNETCPEVNCSSFLTALRRQRSPRFEGSAGLPEICRHCDQRLDITPGPAKKAAFDQQEVDKWRERNDLAAAFKQLTSEEPRIVFIASGGVFRGPFHAGMINAMLALKIKPDLIVGASVGTLVGGALGATLATRDRDRQKSLKVLGDLVDTFQNVDERIAFTQTLKNAARELGLRSRMVDLAPCELRKKILEGSKGDPGFAVTGTPPILIDAISDVLLIPHKATSRIAAQFVAGHFTEAVRLLLAGMKRETLRRLDIVHAVMGTSLLEPAARRLLGGDTFDMNSSQPYNSDGIAIFGTSTDLINEQPVLLGRYKFDLPSYDFIKACLASSAFPAVFAPRKDSEIFPGLGDPEVVYSDGGMFDNLPIAPALEILTASQRNWIKIKQKDAVQELDRRLNNPDLFFTGSLDVNPSPDEKIFDDIVSINRRAGTLQNNLKIQAFEEVCRLVGEHFRHLHRAVEAYKALPGSKFDDGYLNGLVNAVLFAVYPIDKDHLNGTFQFCNSLGRKLKVVNRSMADGCFQTMAELTFAFGKPDRHPGRTKAVQNFARKGRMPVLGPSKKRASTKNLKGPGYHCPFFAKWENGERVKFICPFSENPVSVAVFESCRKDRKHKRQYRKDLVQITPRPIPDAAMAQPA